MSKMTRIWYSECHEYGGGKNLESISNEIQTKIYARIDVGQWKIGYPAESTDGNMATFLQQAVDNSREYAQSLGFRLRLFDYRRNPAANDPSDQFQVVIIKD